MRSFPHHRNIGWRVASSRFTVMTRVSGHRSIGPTGVCDQSKLRVSSAISPSPKIRDGMFVIRLRAFRAMNFAFGLGGRDLERSVAYRTGTAARLDSKSNLDD